MRKIYSKAGWLHYPELEFYYTQGEENVEPVQFVLPKNREEVDLTALSYQIKVVSEDYGTEAAWILPKKMTDEHILLDWEITREFTAMPGRAFLTLTGTDSKNNVVAKWTGHPVQIRKDPKGTQPVPPPDKLEQFENQVNQAVEKITGALEKADASLDGMVPVLEDATKTANTLIEHSKHRKNPATGRNRIQERLRKVQSGNRDDRKGGGSDFQSGRCSQNSDQCGGNGKYSS